MSPLDPRTAIEVLAQLQQELGDIDPDTRAIVGLRPELSGTVALADVDLQDNGVLQVPSDVEGLVVVTAEEVSSGGEVVGLTQLMCVLRSGTEIGIYRVSDDQELRVWRTDADPDDAAADLRPRDLASNSARLALGLPSLVDPIPVTDLAARTWLLNVATAALQLFDGEDGLTVVTPGDLAEVAASSPLAALAVGEDELPSLKEIHAAAVSGELHLGGHLKVDPVHAAWLDPDGLAQVLDRTLPSMDELLGSLQVSGDDDLLAWAIGWLSAREWYQPN